jgi:hypothetical protein
VIKVGTLAKIRRLYFRDKQSIKEICRQTGLSRNTVRTWLREPEMSEPKYRARVVVTKLDALQTPCACGSKQMQAEANASGAPKARCGKRCARWGTRVATAVFAHLHASGNKAKVKLVPKRPLSP